MSGKTGLSSIIYLSIIYPSIIYRLLVIIKIN